MPSVVPARKSPGLAHGEAVQPYVSAGEPSGRANFSLARVAPSYWTSSSERHQLG
jgi:hypothetical protein